MGPRDDRPVDAEVGDHLAARLRRSRDRLVTPVDAEVARAHLAEIAAAAELTARERRSPADHGAKVPAALWVARPGRGQLLAGLRMAAASGLAATAAILGLAIVGALPPTAAQAVAAAAGWMGVELPGLPSSAGDGEGAAEAGATGAEVVGPGVAGAGPAGALLLPHVLGPRPLPGLPGGVADGRGLMLGRDGGLGPDRDGRERGAPQDGAHGDRRANSDGTPGGSGDPGAEPSDPDGNVPEPAPDGADLRGPGDSDTPGRGDDDRTEPSPRDPDRPGQPDEPGQPSEPGRNTDRPEPPGRNGGGQAPQPDAPRSDRSADGDQRTGSTGSDTGGSGSTGD
jgi:hypothetical protein